MDTAYTGKAVCKGSFLGMDRNCANRDSYRSIRLRNFDALEDVFRFSTNIWARGVVYMKVKNGGACLYVCIYAVLQHQRCTAGHQGYKRQPHLFMFQLGLNIGSEQMHVGPLHDTWYHTTSKLPVQQTN